MKLLHLRALGLIVLGLVVIFGLTRWGDPPVTLVDASPTSSAPCRIHTLPSRCDGKCQRQDTRSYT